MARLDDPAAGHSVSDFVRGAPAWMEPMLRYCSRCGGDLGYGAVPGEERARHYCTVCGQVTYVNPRLVATTVPMPDDEHVVLIKRGIPPGVGTWAQPGGFLESDETVIAGAVRETQEETGLLVEPSRIVGIYAQPRAAVVVVAYAAAIVGGEIRRTPEALEVRTFAIDEIPWEGLAFTTSLWAMRDLVRSLRPGLDVERLGRERLDF
jgi:ADP-ribose pyrophosphatase YjhB (NUDIX family)